MELINGDVLLTVDRIDVALLEQLADEWDPVRRRDTAFVIRELGAREVQLGIARPEAALLPQDHALWADLREELAATGIVLREPVGLPAAA